MSSPLTGLGVATPVLAAPMAGGPSTPALVTAAAETGGLGFLAGGYQTVDLLAEQIRTVRSSTDRFGVNLFAPNPIPIGEDEYHRYARAIQPAADRYGINLADTPLRDDDDGWRDKVDLLIDQPVPVISFTFGIPEPAVVRELKWTGAVIVQTVTSPQEAVQAEEAGADLLAVQAAAAGGHSGTLTPEVAPPQVSLTELLAQVRNRCGLPLIAAGGLATPDEVREAIAAGASAVAVGTVLLRCRESGASEVHKDALADPRFTQTVVTRAFTGRPARALANEFTERHSQDAPLGYPAVHHLTRPLRKAAANAGDPHHLHLWAGTGFRSATEEPAADIIERLAGEL